MEKMYWGKSKQSQCPMITYGMHFSIPFHGSVKILTTSPLYHLYFQREYKESEDFPK
jgi:hypothetical protein